jgi:hypothetical protein
MDVAVYLMRKDPLFGHEDICVFCPFSPFLKSFARTIYS